MKHLFLTLALLSLTGCLSQFVHRNDGKPLDPIQETSLAFSTYTQVLGGINDLRDLGVVSDAMASKIEPFRSTARSYLNSMNDQATEYAKVTKAGGTYDRSSFDRNLTAFNAAILNLKNVLPTATTKPTTRPVLFLPHPRL